jgi:hypothetical protein
LQAKRRFSPRPPTQKVISLISPSELPHARNWFSRGVPADRLSAAENSAMDGRKQSPSLIFAQQRTASRFREISYTTFEGRDATRIA